MEAVRVETQPISAVEAPQVPESFVPATSIETSVDTLPSGNSATQSNEVPAAVASVAKVDTVAPVSILGYPTTQILEDGRVLTTGEFAAALAAQKSQHVNIEDLPLAV